MCQKCGKVFEPASGAQKYCSDCRTAARKERMKEFRKREKQRTADTPCCLCGAPFGEMIAGKPYCWKHRARYWKYGTFDLPVRSKKLTSEIVLQGETASITTSKGEVIVIDAEDWNAVKEYSWRVDNSGYAVTTINGRAVYLHRMILGDAIPKGYEVDHADGDKLYNRRRNLRICKHRENLRNRGISKNNTSGYPGVFACRDGRYRVTIMVDYNAINIGRYNTFEEAVEARKKAEDNYHQGFAGHLRREMEEHK